jgi:hypothetical protein
VRPFAYANYLAILFAVFTARSVTLGPLGVAIGIISGFIVAVAWIEFCRAQPEEH